MREIKNNIKSRENVRRLFGHDRHYETDSFRY